jgi:hypothetical protein
MQLKKMRASTYAWLKRDFAFHAGADWLFQHGYIDGLRIWLKEHGKSEEFIEQECEHCLRSYYLN